MRLQKNLGNIALFIAAGIFTFSPPVIAKTPETQPHQTPVHHSLIAQSDLTRPNEPFDLSWVIQWSVSSIVHRSILKIDGYSGVSMTTYWNPETKKNECVTQDVELYDSPDGLIIYSYNPRYCFTNTANNTYAADNFIIAQDGNDLQAFVVDDRGVKAAVRIETLK
ncbi:hypothetical protein H6F32_17735 [Anabaena sp. FACHB-1237]|uniref:hypothetical protein n=1 Tax=Anabaena sp. FACHB-1237 TaxID=2692769 RepID=UPI00168084F7|nr:hypothetical protein [Anabaena sp. FACHB-1237]MBD2139362.1 hypothetical protein [Anabaena sp. FACHB-1237]